MTNETDVKSALHAHPSFAALSHSRDNMIENIYRDRLFTVTKNRNQQFLSKITGSLSNSTRLLDIGCGDGSILFDLDVEKLGAIYTGIDISEANIQRAQGLHARRSIDFVCSDYTTHKFSTPFQLIVSYSTLNIIPRPELVLRKIREDLAPGGKLIVALPYDCLRSKIYIFSRKVLSLINLPAINRAVVAFLRPVLMRRYSKEEIKQSIVYMTMPPYLIDDEKFRTLMTALGLDLIDEERELPTVFGKLSHKLLTFQKR